MMYSEEKTIKKSTGIYRCLDDINNLTIRVQIKEIINESLVNSAETKDLESKNFQWQQKVFGRWERNFYKDKNNCVTDLDLKYHEEIAKSSDNDDLLYSYVQVDDFCLQEEPVCNSKNITHLQNGGGFDPESDENDKNGFDMVKSIEKCAQNSGFCVDYKYMYIMADFGEYVDDTWIKTEFILCSLKYDVNKKVLLIYPDFTEFYPYRFTINNDMSRTYEYTIENTSESIDPEIIDKEQIILNKITNHEKKIKEQLIGNNFVVPPRRKLFVYLFIEICHAENFENNDIYVQYFIDLPENCCCLDQSSLTGTTHCCHVKDDEGTAHFGFPIETVLIYDIEDLKETETFPAPCIYFEVISKDSWNRYRTEGLAYKNLPISQPGKSIFELHCLRILPRNLSGNLRRFFIGDYKCYDDITWIGRPKGHEDETLNKYGVDTVGTGQLTFSFSVIHQSQAFCDNDEKSIRNRRETVILDKLKSSALIKSVEQVLEAFKIAKKNMLEARRKV